MSIRPTSSRWNAKNYWTRAAVPTPPPNAEQRDAVGGGVLPPLEQRQREAVLNVCPFPHVPQRPAGQAHGALLVLSAVAVVLVTAGLAGFRRRDVG